MNLVNLTLRSSSHFLARMLFDTMGERGRKEFIKTDPKFFSLDGGLLKYFSIQSVSFQKSYVQIVTQYACVTIKHMFSSAIFRSPIKAIHSAG